jgi:hypothetical protein
MFGFSCQGLISVHKKREKSLNVREDGTNLEALFELLDELFPVRSESVDSDTAFLSQLSDLGCISSLDRVAF